MENRAPLSFTVFLIAVSVFLSSCTVFSHSSDPLKSILGDENTRSWEKQIMSAIAQAPGPSATGHWNTLVLAENRTKRPDILSGFHEYRGGWDIANKHYWASVGFTGAAAFILAMLWLICFGLALIVHRFCGWKMNMKDKESSWSQRICLIVLLGWKMNMKDKESNWSQRICLIVLLVFTSVAAVGCILLFVGQDDFSKESMHTLKYVVNQSDYTVQTVRNVTQYLTLAKSISVAQIFLPKDVMDDIDRLNVDLNTAADILEQKTDENARKIQRVFNKVRAAMMTVAAVMLVISLLGLVLSILGYERLIYIFIIAGWLLVAVTFVLCGLFVILNNAITDTCMAMGEWVENPHAETALSNILPCVDQSTTNQTLYKSKQIINDLTSLVDGYIDSTANSNPPPQSFPYYFNQTGPLVPHLCYPYDSQLQDRQCSPGEVSTANASLVWQNYTCTVSASGICTSIGRLTPEMYSELVAAVNVSYALEHYAPPLLSLQNCDFVRDTFRNITSNYCPPLEHYLRVVNAGLGLISAGVMLSLALWILYANCPQRKEVFAKLSSRTRVTCTGEASSRSNNNVTTDRAANDTAWTSINLE